MLCKIIELGPGDDYIRLGVRHLLEGKVVWLVDEIYCKFVVEDDLNNLGEAVGYKKLTGEDFEFDCYLGANIIVEPIEI